MNWARFAMTVAAAGVAASFTDWLFMGVLFHGKYLETPEMWRRPQGGKGETQAIVLTSLVSTISCAVIIYVCERIHMHTYAQSLKLAVAMWVAALPILATFSIWTKYHPTLAVSHSLGWLARFVLSAVAATLLMH
jgi:hypothetical protein